MSVRQRRDTSCAAVLALCVATGAASADPVADLASKYGPALTNCLSQPGDGAVCKGQLAGPCMDREEGGQSTLGMVWCTAAATRVWDGWLNAEYQQSLNWARAMDAADQENFPEFANRVESLRAAQRAWIAFRDAECGLDYAVWGAGSMRQIAGASCQLEMTADRTLTLRALRGRMR